MAPARTAEEEAAIKAAMMVSLAHPVQKISLANEN